MAMRMNGWIILDKPLGLGSTQGVSAVKRALRQGGYAKVKVGHGGTLDPLATGVLPIALGEATKLAGRMLESDKVYDFTVQFGTQTDTLDAEGVVVAQSDVRPTLAEVEAVLTRYTGPISQMPPAYSALKVDGKRAYDLARAGEEVILNERAVEIYALSPSPLAGEDSGAYERSELAQLGEGGLLSPPSAPSPTATRRQAAKSSACLVACPQQTSRKRPLPQGERLNQITLTAHVSKGTYIRSLARDIALALRTVGHVTMLRRTQAGPFSLQHAISLDKLDESARSQRLEACLLPLRAALADIPVLPLSPDQADALRVGRPLIGIAAADGLAFAQHGETLIALVQIDDGNVTVERGFNM
jgi:tRNA pseudouridine55 synthase